MIQPKAKLMGDFQGMEKAKAAKLVVMGEMQKQSALSSEKKAEFAKAARGFESMFMNMMFKEMKKNIKGNFGEEEGGDMSFGADTLEGYTDMAFTDQLSNIGSGIGIAEKIYQQLTNGEKLNTHTEFVPKTLHQMKQLLQKRAIANPQKTNANDEIAVGDTFIDRLQSRLSNYQDTIALAAKKYDVPEGLIKAVIGAESAGRNTARSGAGAKGLMQLMDGTAKDLGVSDSYNPIQNIMGGTKYLRQMLDKFGGNKELALAAYNSGPGNVDKYNGIPPFNETKSYVKRVKKYEQILG